MSPLHETLLAVADRYTTDRTTVTLDIDTGMLHIEGDVRDTQRDIVRELSGCPRLMRRVRPQFNVDGRTIYGLVPSTTPLGQVRISRTLSEIPPFS